MARKKVLFKSIERAKTNGFIIEKFNNIQAFKFCKVFKDSIKLKAPKTSIK